MPDLLNENVAESGAPDWIAITEEILCPLCGYNLRGLTQARCPECGYMFEWPDMLDPRRRLHPYLFEHHPECNVRSFVRTALGSLRPKRFWTSLHPIQPSKPRRLVAYWVTGIAIYAISILLLLGICTLVVEIQERRAVAERLAATRALLQQDPALAGRLMQIFGSMQAYLDWVAQDTQSDFHWELRSEFHRLLRMGLTGLTTAAYATVAVPFTWAWATWVSLLVFQWTIRKHRIRPIHLLRSSVYSFDQVLWIGAALLLGLSAGQHSAAMAAALGLACLGALLVSVLRLWCALKFYLRVNGAGRMLLASQAIVILLQMEVLVRLMNAFHPEA